MADMKAPEATVLRLSRYHCFVGQLLAADPARRIRSREMATELGVTEETVRRDLSYANVEGRPGAGYDLKALYTALEEFLELSEHHPFIVIAQRDMLGALETMFPAEQFGLRPVAYFSPREDEAGETLSGVPIHALTDLGEVGPSTGARIALIACAPDKVDIAMLGLSEAKITGVLMLTPNLKPHHPADLNVTYFRIPCTLKSLVAAEAAPATPSCCSA